MLIRIRKLVLSLLLVCLPLQSVAGPAHVLFCDDATPAAAYELHVHDDGDEHPAQDAPAGPGGISSHDCCQHYFSGVVHGISPDVNPTRLVYVADGLAGFYSFFPEHPKRPPPSALAV